ncbi:MAG: hypothetical protein EBU17_06440 [Burkholderiaceae bacterium]|nr:hypothetical protein [Burkholderiaceae bacterium]
MVETKIAVPGGDVVQRAFMVADHGGCVVMEISNESQSFTELLTKLIGLKIAAIAAIGNPQKFFSALSNLGMHLEHTLSLPDHVAIKNTDIAEIDADFIFITEKDAVKCSAIEDHRIWVVPMHLPLSNELSSWVQEVIQRPDPYRR